MEDGGGATKKGMVERVEVVESRRVATRREVGVVDTKTTKSQRRSSSGTGGKAKTCLMPGILYTQQKTTPAALNVSSKL